MSLTAADIFAAKPEIYKYTVESLKGDIYVRLLTPVDRRAMAKFVGKDLDSKSIAANIIYGVCDEDGNRIFTEADYERIDKLPETKIAAMFRAVLEANKIDEKGIAKNL